MATPVTEAVRMAKEALGDATPEDLAAFISANCGMTIKLAIVTITLASFKEKEGLSRIRERAQELVSQAKADQPADKPKRRKPNDTLAEGEVG